MVGYDDEFYSFLLERRWCSDLSVFTHFTPMESTKFNHFLQALCLNSIHDMVIIHYLQIG